MGVAALWLPATLASVLSPKRSAFDLGGSKVRQGDVSTLPRQRPALPPKRFARRPATAFVAVRGRRQFRLPTQTESPGVI
jgi:hypothetical protein